LLTNLPVGLDVVEGLTVVATIKEKKYQS